MWRTVGRWFGWVSVAIGALCLGRFFDTLHPAWLIPLVLGLVVLLICELSAEEIVTPIAEDALDYEAGYDAIAAERAVYDKYQKDRERFSEREARARALGSHRDGQEL